MRLRKDNDLMQEDEIILVAQVSDALAHPARIKIYQYIMQCNKERKPVCNKDVVARLTTPRRQFRSTLKTRAGRSRANAQG